MQWDEDGDATQLAWYVPNPTFLVRPIEDHVHGFDWKVGTLITMTIDRPDTPANPDYQDTQVAVEPRPDMVDFEMGGIFDIRAGDIVTMTDGGLLKQHVVTGLSVTSVDPNTDIVGGTAEPGSQVKVGWLCNEDGCTYRQVETGPTGEWVANFGIPGLGPSEWQTFDIKTGTEGEAFQEDEDGDSTKVRWIAPTPIREFLHGVGPHAKPKVLYLDTTTPPAAVAKYVDSPSISRGRGNPWIRVGTWNAAPPIAGSNLVSLKDVVLWLGLGNAADQGTNFDLRAEVYLNDVFLASAERYCVKGATRNPDLAKEVALPFGSFPPTGFDGSSVVLYLRVWTRIGTNGAGGSCGGHGGATGLRLYFDAVNRPSRFDVVVGP
jgi:hypothetical protein